MSLFDDFAQSLRLVAELTGFDSVEEGVVYSARTNRLVAYRARLCSSLEPAVPEPKFLGDQWAAEAGRVRVIDLLETVKQLATGSLGLGKLLFYKAESQANWAFYPDYSSGPTRHFTLQGTTNFDVSTLVGVGSEKLRAADRQVAAESDYRFASVSRLVKAFTGLDWALEANARPIVRVDAPWPIQNFRIQADYATAVPTFSAELEALGQIATDRVVLNTETDQGDVRIGPEELRWLKSPTDQGDRTLWRATLSLRRVPKIVHAFVRGLPAIALVSMVPERLTGVVYSAEGPPPIIPGWSAEPPLSLEQINLNNYRLLESAQFSFATAPVSLLIGPNQSGKSTLLDAFDLLNCAATGRLEAGIRHRGGLDSIRTRGTGTDVAVTVVLSDDAKATVSYRLDLLGVGDSYEIVEALASDGAPVLTRRGSQLRIGTAEPRTFSTSEATLWELRNTHPTVSRVTECLARFRLHAGFAVSGAWAEESPQRIRLAGAGSTGEQLQTRGENLTGVMQALQAEQPRDWETILEVVKWCFPQFKDFVFGPGPGKGRVQLIWREEAADFFTSELSDGTLGFLCVLVALLRDGPTLVGIDEPEIHLHPTLLHRVAGVALSLSSPKRVLLTTHSDALLDFVSERPEVVCVARRVGGHASFERPQLDSLRQWIDEFGLRNLRRELETWRPLSAATNEGPTSH